VFKSNGEISILASAGLYTEWAGLCDDQVKCGKVSSDGLCKSTEMFVR